MTTTDTETDHRHVRLAGGVAIESDANPVAIDAAGLPGYVTRYDAEVVTGAYYAVARRLYAEGNRRAAADALTKAQEASGAYGLGASRPYYPVNELPSDDMQHRAAPRFGRHHN